MQRCTISANDNYPLSFQTSHALPDHPSSPPASPLPTTLIILLHGFSGSSAYFTRNIPHLTSNPSLWVIAPDLRGHGFSQPPPTKQINGGYHVSRLALDLRHLIEHVRFSCRRNHDSDPLSIIAVGCSLGAAILWTYAELFTSADFAGLVFVDQAPLQNRSSFGSWDARFAHKGLYDEPSLLAAQKFWMEAPESAYRALVGECLGYRHAPLGGGGGGGGGGGDGVSAEQAREDEAFFAGESRRCDAVWLARLMADHTAYDHRESIEGIACPVMVMAGRRSGCFTLEGVRETVRRLDKGHAHRKTHGVVRWTEFDSGHWLFFEESDRFNTELLHFVGDCTASSRTC